MADAPAIMSAGALEGLYLGVSVSDSPDLAQLGLSEVHLKLALGEVTRAMLLAGAGLVYGGRLDPDGYTAFLQSELEKYGRRDQPLVVCLAWQEHRELGLAELQEAERDLGLLGRIVYLDLDGAEVTADAGRGEGPVAVAEPKLRARALTSVRRYMAAQTDARLVVGGRRCGYQGVMPGVVEEALFAIQGGQPVFLAGGFGGATAEAARALGLGVPDWPEIGSDRDAGHEDGLRALERAAREHGWRPESNGLSEEENLRLAASHRASDVAALVALGLGRLRSVGG